MITQAFSRFIWPPGLGSPALKTLQSTLTFFEFWKHRHRIKHVTLHQTLATRVLTTLHSAIWDHEIPLSSMLCSASTGGQFHAAAQVQSGEGLRWGQAGSGCRALPNGCSPNCPQRKGLSRSEEQYCQKPFPAHLCGILTHRLSSE